MNRGLTLGLSLLGVAISVVGFYVSNARDFPVVQGLVAPDYVNAKAGISALQHNEELTPLSLGFEPLAKIIVARVSAMNPTIPTSEIVVERINAGGGGMAFGMGTSQPTVKLQVQLRMAEKVWEWDLLELKQEVERTWKSRSLIWATWLFWIGVVQTTWPLVVGAFVGNGSKSRQLREPRN